MKRSTVFSACIILAAGAVALASDTAATAAKNASPFPAMPEFAKAVLPKCDVSFELAKEPIHMPTVAYPREVAGQKYATEIEMIVPVEDAFQGKSEVPEYWELGQQVQKLRRAFLASEDQNEIVGYFAKLPQNVRPLTHVADELSSPFLTAIWNVSGNGPTIRPVPGFACRTFYLFTQTADRPKALIKTLLDVYGYGIALPEQSRFLDKGNSASQSVPGYKRWLDEMPAAIAEDKKQLDALREFEDISQAALDKFKVERRALEIDRAAAKGRVEACEKILSNGAGTAKEQIVAAKFAAEIELAGLDSKHAVLDRIVVNAQKRFDLQTKLHDDKVCLDSARQYIGPYRKAAREMAEGARAWALCPIVGKVVTSEIRWEK
jgi:hypothetical protein